MGAGTVSEAIADRPDLFRAAVLEDPAWMSAAKVAEVMEMARQAAAAAATMSSLEVSERFGSPPSDPVDHLNWEESKRQHRQPEWDGTTPSIFETQWQDSVRRFRCPVLLVWGTHGLVTAEIIEEARDLFPGLDDVQLDAGHGLRYDAFEPYVAAVGRFLAAAPPTAPLDLTRRERSGIRRRAHGDRTATGPPRSWRCRDRSRRTRSGGTPP